jgi:hypothetical protein
MYGPTRRCWGQELACDDSSSPIHRVCCFRSKPTPLQRLVAERRDAEREAGRVRDARGDVRLGDCRVYADGATFVSSASATPSATIVAYASLINVSAVKTFNMWSFWKRFSYDGVRYLLQKDPSSSFSTCQHLRLVFSCHSIVHGTRLAFLYAAPPSVRSPG